MKDGRRRIRISACRPVCFRRRLLSYSFNVSTPLPANLAHNLHARRRKRSESAADLPNLVETLVRKDDENLGRRTGYAECRVSEIASMRNLHAEVESRLAKL